MSESFTCKFWMYLSIIPAKNSIPINRWCFGITMRRSKTPFLMAKLTSLSWNLSSFILFIFLLAVCFKWTRHPTGFDSEKWIEALERKLTWSLIWYRNDPMLECDGNPFDHNCHSHPLVVPVLDVQTGNNKWCLESTIIILVEWVWYTWYQSYRYLLVMHIRSDCVEKLNTMRRFAYNRMH